MEDPGWKFAAFLEHLENGLVVITILRPDNKTVARLAKLPAFGHHQDFNTFLLELYDQVKPEPITIAEYQPRTCNRIRGRLSQGRPFPRRHIKPLRNIRPFVRSSCDVGIACMFLRGNPVPLAFKGIGWQDRKST